MAGLALDLAGLVLFSFFFFASFDPKLDILSIMTHKCSRKQFEDKHIKKYRNIFEFSEGWLLDYKYVASRTKTEENLGEKVLVIAADYTLPVFLLYYMG